MRLPLDPTRMTIKDWVVIGAALVSLAGSWALMGGDIESLKTHVLSQAQRDERQDDQMIANRNEVIGTINRTADEIKEEIRELRRELRRGK
jgi:hypothetical protein